MASIMIGLNPDYMAKAITDRVIGDIKADLRARIMPQIEAEVDAAVDAVVAALGPSVKAAMVENYDRLGRELAIMVTTKHLKAHDPRPR